MLKNISIKVKLMLFIAISLVLLWLGLTIVVDKKVKKELINYQFNHLHSLEVAIHQRLKDYFKDTKELLLSTAKNIATIEAIDALNNGYDSIIGRFGNTQKKLSDEQLDILQQYYKINYIGNINSTIAPKRDINDYIPKNEIGKILQYRYIVKNNYPNIKKQYFETNKEFRNTLYDRAHRYYHNNFLTILQKFGLYDIFLINNNGDIVYSVFKEVDFGTNLLNGVYKDTNLAKIVKKALYSKKQDIFFADFKPYEPSYNIPASFVATPIFDKNNKKIGVMAFQLPKEDIDNIVRFNNKFQKAGIGKSGDIYLVGSDYYLRSDIRFIDKTNEIAKKLHSTVGVFKIEKSYIKNILSSNKIGKTITKDYKNKDILLVSHQVRPFNQAKWALVVSIDKSEVLEPIDKLLENIAIIGLLVTFILIIFSLYFINILVIKRLDNIKKYLLLFFKFLNGEQKSVAVLKNDTNDEIGNMIDAINRSIIITKQNIKEKEKKAWIDEGLFNVNKKLINIETLDKLTDTALRYIVSYINANTAVIYIYDEDKQVLKLNNFFANNKDRLKQEYNIGEDIVGEVAKTKQYMVIRGVLEINSATSINKAKYVYVFPILFKDEIVGVIEIGSMSNIKDKGVELLKNLEHILGGLIYSIIKNNKIEKLLQESRYQQQKLEEANVQMEEQQQKLEETNAYMEEQQQQLEMQNQELQEKKKEIEQALNELHKANKYKDEFFANMSHELRTPLNAIILLSKLLSDDKNIDKDGKKKAMTIYKSGNELLELINDILDLSKIESGKMEVVVDRFYPKELLDDLYNLYSHSAKYKGLKFKTKDNYKNMITTDKKRLSQILKNLISNGIKFTKSGFIEVVFEQNDNKDLPIKIVVKDSGIGIPKDKQSDIFKAFVQADGKVDRKYGGTGLGLSIVIQLLNLLGGKIDLKSETDRGSEFIIQLPNLNDSDMIMQTDKSLVETQENKAVEFIEDDIGEDIDIISDISLNGINILVVDDDIKNIFVLDSGLQGYEADVFVAYDGKEAIEQFQNNNIDVILMDMNMPVMDGYEAIKEIRKLNQDIIIISVTALDDEKGCLEVGANDYVSKPINLDTLVNIIKVWYEKSKKNR